LRFIHRFDHHKSSLKVNHAGPDRQCPLDTHT